MRNITASKEIIPWTCHICGGQFETRSGGICSKCNKATCRKHLKQIGKKLKLESTWLCQKYMTEDK